MPDLLKLEEISDSLKQYMMLNIEIIKLEATERISTIGSSIVSSLAVGISAFLFVFTISIGLGFYLSSFFSNFYTGFGIIGAFYFLLTIILVVSKNKFIEKPLRNKIIKKMLEK